MYYNTTQQKGEVLKKFHEDERSQTQIVKEYFGSHPCEVLGASEVWDRLISNRQIAPLTPLTSIRRAITDLSKTGIVIKSESTKRGAFNRPEHCYFLNVSMGQLNLL